MAVRPTEQLSCNMMQRADGNSYATPLRSAREIYEELIEQGHRGAKRRIRSLLGFKSGAEASITLDGIELIQKMRKQRIVFASATPR
jgi:putative transposase